MLTDLSPPGEQKRFQRFKKKKSGKRKLLGKEQELKTSQLVAISGMGLPIQICKDKRLLQK